MGGMRIDHLALHVPDLEAGRDFFVTYFGGSAGKKYVNLTTGFSSYFVSFEDGARLEIMHNEARTQAPSEAHVGFHHIAFSVGSHEAVDAKARELQAAGFELVSGPRTTGDGYYEAVIVDLFGNHIEITI